MKKLMDIISNWNKGKKAHDQKVFDQEAAVDNLNKILDEIQKQVHIQKVHNLLTAIRHWCKDGDKELEAKHWQILAEYAQDQVKALTVIKSDIVPTEATNDNTTFNPLKDRISTTIDGDTLRTIIQRAEKRHGYGIQP